MVAGEESRSSGSGEEPALSYRPDIDGRQASAAGRRPRARGVGDQLAITGRRRGYWPPAPPGVARTRPRQSEVVSRPVIEAAGGGSRRRRASRPILDLSSSWSAAGLADATRSAFDQVLAVMSSVGVLDLWFVRSMNQCVRPAGPRRVGYEPPAARMPTASPPSPPPRIPRRGVASMPAGGLAITFWWRRAASRARTGYDIAVLVCEDLDLDVTRAGESFAINTRSSPEAALARVGGAGGGEVLCALDLAHALPPGPRPCTPISCRPGSLRPLLRLASRRRYRACSSPRPGISSWRRPSAHARIAEGGGPTHISRHWDRLGEGGVLHRQP